MKQELLNALKTLKKNGPIYPRSGICDNIDEIIEVFCTWEVIFAQICRKWPKFSGSVAYPIEGHDLFYKTRYKWEGESGKLRWELVDFLISELEAELNPLKTSQPPANGHI